MRRTCRFVETDDRERSSLALRAPIPSRNRRDRRFDRGLQQTSRISAQKASTARTGIVVPTERHETRPQGSAATSTRAKTVSPAARLGAVPVARCSPIPAYKCIGDWVDARCEAWETNRCIDLIAPTMSRHYRTARRGVNRSEALRAALYWIATTSDTSLNRPNHDHTHGRVRAGAGY